MEVVALEKLAGIEKPVPYEGPGLKPFLRLVEVDRVRVLVNGLEY